MTGKPASTTHLKVHESHGLSVSRALLSAGQGSLVPATKTGQVQTVCPYPRHTRCISVDSGRGLVIPHPLRPVADYLGVDQNPQQNPEWAMASDAGR